MDYKIGMLWIGGRLSWLEQMCIKSYLRAGHEVDLYHYDEITNVPNGVNLLDAREILDGDYIYRHFIKGSPAIHADKFRYRLLLERDDVIWSDADAYCLRPYHPHNEYFLSWGTKGMIFIGVLKLPSHSKALQEAVHFTNNDFPIPPWESEKYNRYLKFRKSIGLPVHVTKQRWTVWGPRMLTYFMKKHEELEYVMPEKALYPVSAATKEKLLDGSVSLDTLRKDDEVYSVHLYAEWLKPELARIGKVPENSLLAQLAEATDTVIDMQDIIAVGNAKKKGKVLKYIRKKLKI